MHFCTKYCSISHLTHFSVLFLFCFLIKILLHFVWHTVYKAQTWFPVLSLISLAASTIWIRVPRIIKIFLSCIDDEAGSNSISAPEVSFIFFNGLSSPGRYKRLINTSNVYSSKCFLIKRTTLSMSLCFHQIF